MTGLRTAPARTAAVLAVLLAVLIPTGCTGPEPHREDAVDPHAELLARPSLEEMTARYQQMQDRIRTEVDAVVGPQKWRQIDPPTRTPCGFDFPREYDARSFTLGLYGFDANVPDDRWPQVERVVLAIARENGFTEPAELRIDRPGRHEVGAVDPTSGANLDFATQRTTILTVISGCHLPAARKGS